MPCPTISKLSFGRNSSYIGIGQARPTLSWRFASDGEDDWVQRSYQISVTRNGRETIHDAVQSSRNIDVPWPANEPDLVSRELAVVKVRTDGEWFSETLEVALLERADWTSSFIAPHIPPPVNLPKRPFHLRQTFSVAETNHARIYATALGVYEVKLNGERVGDHVMAPGWQSYDHRLHYQTHILDNLRIGDNIIEVLVAEGWYSGRLTWFPDQRNFWGKEIGAMIQVEVGGKPVLVSDTRWEWSYGNLHSAELYDGETYNVDEPRNWHSVKCLDFPKAKLVSPEAPPIRRIAELAPLELLITPSGKRVLDFGQNFVGWLRIKHVPAGPGTITLRFAEVLEKQEVASRPLRSAQATDRIRLGHTDIPEWEPKFTTHGFRYCEIDAPTAVFDTWRENFVGVVVHSDMERLGDFVCSHELINKLHENVVWGLRSNFVGLPTDCPQRDERLGWTGDLQVFAATASFLYDTSGFLANWLQDLSAEQLLDNQGVVPLVVPNTLWRDEAPFPQAIWGDVCVMTPRDLYHAYGSTMILQEMWESMTTWLDKGIPRGANGLWLNETNGFQLADWLDPRAPPDHPGAALTDQYLVADAYLVGVTKALAVMAVTLDKSEARRYEEEHNRLRSAFQHEYLAASGRLSSDTQTAYSLAFQFGLLDDQHLSTAAERLVRLVTRGGFRIATGFAGTPGILQALTEAGHLQVAYRMLLEKGCPSWLYPVTMGATTVWERWDSLLPDGSVNPGEMTSFNHYALGAVARWLYTTVGGLRSCHAGYKHFIVEPRPGGTITSAAVHTITPSGRAAVSWTLRSGKLAVDVEVPPNTTAELRLGTEYEVVGSGRHKREVDYDAGAWPPASYHPRFFHDPPEDTLAE